MKSIRSAVRAVIVALTSFIGWASASAAENVSWTAHPMDAEGEMISRSGALVYAYAGAGGSASGAGEITVNGTAFTTFPSFGNKPSGLTISFSLSPSFTMSGNNWGSCGVADPSYAQMLNSGWWYRGATSTTVKAKGLEVGTRYLLQLVFHKETARHEESIKISAPGEDGLSVYDEGADWPYGGTLICTFKATGDYEAFALPFEVSSGNNDMLINALQVRNLDQEADPYVAPKINTVTADVSGTKATVSLSGIKLGTDREGNAATSYSLAYSLNGGDSVTVGTSLSEDAAAFDISGLADGSYTCVVAVLTDKNETATNSVKFAINTSLRWKALPMSESGDTIETRGSLVYSYARVDSTVNAVPFTGLGTVNLDCATKEGYGKAKFFINKTLYRSDLSTAEDDAVKLQENFWRGGVQDDGVATFELKELNPGNRYLVQIVFSLQQSYASGTQVATSDGRIVKANGSGWNYGGTLIGTFTAADVTTTFELTYTKYYLINALQVRKLPNALVMRLR